MSWRGKIGLIGVVWITAVFRFHALFANTFHGDEALFATWARLIAVWRDPLLLTQAVDKPPLLFYLQALFYPLQGPVEWAARLPNFIASIVLVPLVGVLVWRWYRDEGTAVLAALFLALSPFAIQFSATAFTDPLMVMWLVAALVVASPRNPQAAARSPDRAIRWLGLETGHSKHRWLMRAFCLVWPSLPNTRHGSFCRLLIGVGWLAGWRWRDWLRFAVGLLIVLLAILLWDFATDGAVFAVGAADGEFWRGASELVMGDLGATGVPGGSCGRRLWVSSVGGGFDGVGGRTAVIQFGKGFITKGQRDKGTK